MSSTNRNERVRRFLKSITDIGNVGSLSDLKSGFQRGNAPASEDARSLLYKFREERGLDEPAQVSEQLVRSGGLTGIREALSGVKSRKVDGQFEMEGSDVDPNPLGFSDEMLRARVENGHSIISDPYIYERKIAEAIKNNNDAINNAPGGGGVDFNDAPALTTDQMESALSAANREVRQEIANQPLLKKLGYTAGTITGDLSEDRTRSLWWLLNAPQAVANTAVDLTLGKANPNLRTRRNIYAQDLFAAEQAGLIRKVADKPLDAKSATKLGLATEDGRGVQIPEKLLKELEASGRAFDESASEWLNFDNFEEASPGVRRGFDNQANAPVYSQRRVNPNILGWAGTGATALAVNAGLGLAGTQGVDGAPGVSRREGYAAAAPDQQDPRVSANAVFEVGTRYLLSRDGKLLPKDDFLLERPDVSGKEFGQYNAYSFDKELDVNPFDDGRMNLGVAKYNNNGIHGREVQFLGQTLSENEAGIPLAGAILGTALGAVIPNARQLRFRNQRSSWKPGKGRAGMIKNVMGYLPDVRRKRWNKIEDTNQNNPLLKNPVIDRVTQSVEDYFTETNPVTGRRDMNVARTGGILAAGGFGGVAAGTAIGLEREDRRRRDNFAERNPNIDYDTYKQNARDLLDQKYKMLADNPAPQGDEKKSKYQVSRTAQQQALMTTALEQQTLVSQIADPVTRELAQRELKKGLDALDEIQRIEAQKGERYA